MKKFVSFNELAAKKNVQVTSMDSSDVKAFNLFMKQAARESAKNSQKANSSASKAYLTR
mgnify:CR=1 FL=1